jgi:citrate synthase
VTESVTITDNRTGESIEIPIVNGGIDAGSFQKLLPGHVVLRSLLRCHRRPASHITELDGEAASSATAATRSSSSPSTPPTSRSPTC